MTDKQWHETMGVNLDSVFGLVRSAVAQMLKQEWAASFPRGHVVLISSTAGQRGEANHADYAVTKGALISFTKSLSSELAPARHPGELRCARLGGHGDVCGVAASHRRLGLRIASGIPVGRAGHVREIAGPVLFLCTPFAGFISGEILNVNGGAVLVG